MFLQSTVNYTQYHNIYRKQHIEHKFPILLLKWNINFVTLNLKRKDTFRPYQLLINNQNVLIVCSLCRCVSDPDPEELSTIVKLESLNFCMDHCVSGDHYTVAPYMYRSHFNHLSLFSLEWIFMCLLRWADWLKHRPHTTHVYGFSPVCVLMCVCRFLAWAKKRPHVTHLYGFSPVWFLMWRRRFST